MGFFKSGDIFCLFLFQFFGKILGAFRLVPSSCVSCVCVFDLGFDSIEELKSLFLSSRKSDFWSKFLSKIIFSNTEYIYSCIYIPPLPIRLLSRWLVWFLWNLTGHGKIAREKAQLTRALIFRLERTEMDMITFRYFRKS